MFIFLLKKNKKIAFITLPIKQQILDYAIEMFFWRFILLLKKNQENCFWLLCRMKQ